MHRWNRRNIEGIQRELQDCDFVHLAKFADAVESDDEESEDDEPTHPNTHHFETLTSGNLLLLKRHDAGINNLAVRFGGHDFDATTIDWVGRRKDIA